MQKVPELIINEQMSQEEKVKNPKRKEKKVPGWSTEENEGKVRLDCGGGHGRDEKME